MTLRIKKTLFFQKAIFHSMTLAGFVEKMMPLTTKKGSLYTSVIITLMESVCHFFSESFVVSFFVICATKEHILNVLN